MENLDLCDRDYVIGGQGAFLVLVRERQHFAEAIRTKIIREITGLPSEPLIKRAQAGTSVNCLAGESRMYRWDRT